MQLLFDYQAFVMQRYGGISKYFAALSSCFHQSKRIDHRLGLLYTENGYLSKKNNLLPSIPGHFLLKKRSRMERWNKRYSKFLLKQNNFDVFHPTYYDPYFLEYIKKPYVITVHDMIHELFPQYFNPQDPTSHFKRKVIKQASHVIAISESTKKDLQLIFNLPDHKISVIHHGLFRPESFDISTIEPIPCHDKQYILYIGERGAYKNFYRFVTAFANITYKNADIHLICAGGAPFGVAEREYLKRLNILDKISQVTVNESSLSYLYKNAIFFCYPSLYEGFGLPIIEAFANGCPVAVSNTSCFAEIGGDAVTYFNPNDIDEMEHAFQLLIDDSRLRQALINKGEKRLKLFSLKSCLEKTLTVYEKFQS